MRTFMGPVDRGGGGWIAGVSVLALAAAASSAFGTVVMTTVPVGNAGNLADDTGFGAVGYDYRISKFEITAGQYTEFLNAVGATDTFSLYNTSMGSNTAGCKIIRAGVSGSFTYSVAADYANRPVNYVSWGDAARFANWMHNGQPTGPQGAGTTEDGSYLLNGVADSALNTITRAPGATWVIPSENEWYKAAFHKNDGLTGNYWEYATSSDTVPGKLLNDLLGNNANYGPNPGTPIDSGIYWTTTIGEFENSLSPYGTFDQNGNVVEWTEERGTGSQRITRGGGWIQNASTLAAASRTPLAAGGTSQNYVGLRLVLVPAPSTAALLACLGAAVLRRRRLPGG